MDKNIRKAIEKRMTERGISNADLARRLKITPQAVGQVVNGQRGTMPASLLAVLNELELELIVIPRGTAHKPSDPKADYQKGDE